MSLRAICSSFEISLTDRAPDQERRRAFKPGQSCELLVDGETVITGFIDAVRASFSAEDHSISVSGRDKAGDLQDCSTASKPGTWKDRSLLNIARDICSPYGISVTSDVDLAPNFKSFKTKEGETAASAVRRMAAYRGAMVTSDSHGRLLITRAGKNRTGAGLIENKNILAASATQSWAQRHSTITVKGVETGGNIFNTATVVSPSGSASDPELAGRYRPLIMVAEATGNNVTLKQNALWEVSRRIAEGYKANVSVQGWRHAGGIWRPNTRVKLQHLWLLTRAELLIVGVRFSHDAARGTSTDLELAPPEAYDILPQPEPKKEEGGLFGD
jgi:prophage tail gpP-like protein